MIALALNISSGAQVVINEAASVGFNSTGTLNITGGGNFFAEDIHIGIHQGNIGGMTIGDMIGSAALVTVDGPNSSLGYGGSTDLSVGYQGMGTLNLTNGASVQGGSATLGYYPTSVGTVTVDSSSIQLTRGNGGFLVIGDGGTGTLEITNNGSVQNDYAYIANAAGSTGTVTVTGGASWTMGSNSGDVLGLLFVGYGGHARLALSAADTLLTVLNDCLAVVQASVPKAGPSAWSTSTEPARSGTTAGTYWSAKPAPAASTSPAVE